APAHAPEQAEESLPSFVQRSTARPDPSVRNAPAEPDFVVMTRPDPAAAAAEPVDPPAGSADAGADELPEPELLQATVSSAAPSATASPAPSRIAPGVRFTTDALIVTGLPSARDCRH